ncbi:glycosyltransferase [Streptomyces sp. ISL-43]|uniref:glycosyltransferase family 2 protein n=1 Tax=Streptomyces sp. ISL-43 TaxID=2819183 RepID=UPI0027E5B2D9|nr:glycosyltransferase [Streptomyces sp. ISL-43]
MHHQPQVAVITPTGMRSNRRRYLGELYDSLTAQDIAWEWIVAPNGRHADPDRLPAAIAADPRVTICARPDPGAAPARNTSLNYVTAPYVCYADDDDLLPSASLSVRYHRAESAGLGWVAGHSADLKKNGRLQTWECAAPAGLHDAGDVWAYWPSPHDGKPPVGHTMLLTRTEIARAYAGHGGLTKGEDYVYVMSVTGNSDGELLPDVVYHYRQHRGQWTKQASYRDRAEYDARTFAWNQGRALREVRRRAVLTGGP